MIVRTVVDGIRRNQRRNYHRRHPRPILIEPETVPIRSRERRLVAGFNCSTPLRDRKILRAHPT